MSRTGSSLFPPAALLALALAVVGGTRAAADGEVTEQDRRATLALWNSTTAEATPYQLKDVGPENVKRLALYKPDAEGGSREYAIRFGVQEPGGHGRGFHKIVVGAAPSDPSAKGWTLVEKVADPACELWTKRVDKSDAERWVEWSARGVAGPVVLNVVEARAVSEAAGIARDPMLRRYQRLYEAAKAAGLFARAKATLYLGEGEDSAVVLGQDAMPLISPSPLGRRYALRLEMQDAAGGPVEAKWFRIDLGGPLAAWATIEGAQAHATKGRWIVKDPGLIATVYVVLPAADDAMARALMEHAETAPLAPALTIGVASRRK